MLLFLKILSIIFLSQLGLNICFMHLFITILIKIRVLSSNPAPPCNILSSFTLFIIHAAQLHHLPEILLIISAKLFVLCDISAKFVLCDNWIL